MKFTKILIFSLFFLVSACKTLQQSDKNDIRESARERRLEKNRI
jgi:hypothetical protein